MSATSSSPSQVDNPTTSERSRHSQDTFDRTLNRLSFWSRHLKTIYLLRILLWAAVIVIFALLLNSCSTSMSHGIYLVDVSYSLDSDTSSTDDTISAILDAPNKPNQLQSVRAGYFGLCAKTSAGFWTCYDCSSCLVQILDVAQQTDQLNLIWAADQFRTHAMTPIFLCINSAASLVCLIVSLSDYMSTISKRLRHLRLAKHLRRLFIRPSLAFGLAITLACFTSFNVALWQHLASATYMSMSTALADGQVKFHVGQAAMALSWLSFALQVIIAISHVIEHRQYPKSLQFLGGLSDTSSSSARQSSVHETADVSIDGDEPPPGPSWQQPQFSADIAIPILMYLAGQRGRDDPVRQRNTAVWVERNREVRTGYAETIPEEP